MQINQISPGFATSPQLDTEGVRRAVAAGFKVIVCNRPDSEAQGQPSSEAIAAAARDAGAEFHYLPIAHGQSTLSEAETLTKILAASKTPVLAYCGSGMRSAALFSASRNQTLINPTDENSTGDGSSVISGFLSALRFPFKGAAAE